MILNPQEYKLICLHVCLIVHVLDKLNVDHTDLYTCMLNIRHNVDPSNVEYWKQLYYFVIFVLIVSLHQEVVAMTDLYFVSIVIDVQSIKSMMSDCYLYYGI